MAAVPLFSEFAAMWEACRAVTFSGSMRVRWMEPSIFIFSSKYFSIGPGKVITTLLITLFLCLLWVFFLLNRKRGLLAYSKRLLHLGQV